MTAQGRITTRNLTVGMKIHVEVGQFWGPAPEGPGQVLGGDTVRSTTRKGDPVAEVTDIHQTPGDRQVRYQVTTTLGHMNCSPSQTQKLATEPAPRKPARDNDGPESLKRLLRF